MVVFYTLDDKNGYKFGKKRQSHDSAVADKMIEMSDGYVYMRSDSLPFFKKSDLTRCRTFVEFEDIPDDAYVFLEEELPKDRIGAVNKIIIFRWNRVYPATQRLSLHGLGTPIEEFEGNSHEKISVIEYEAIFDEKE